MSDEADLIIKNIDSLEKTGAETLFKTSASLFGSSDVYQQLLTIIDGYSYLNDIIFIFTTNDEDFFKDNVLFMSGRIDHKYKIDYPTKETICDMYKFYMNKELNINKIFLC